MYKYILSKRNKIKQRKPLSKMHSYYFQDIDIPLNESKVLEVLNNLSDRKLKKVFKIREGNKGEFTVRDAHIKVLNLFHSGLYQLPENIDNLSFLEYLDYSDNCLTELPDSIGNLKTLEALWIENQLNEIPESFLNFNYEPYIHLKGNEIKYNELIGKMREKGICIDGYKT